MNDDSAARWMQISEGDLSRALNCSAANDILGACYNSQQTIETAIKAALVFEDVQFPHVHDLRRLCNMLPDDWPVKNMQYNLQKFQHRTR